MNLAALLTNLVCLPYIEVRTYTSGLVPSLTHGMQAGSVAVWVAFCVLTAMHIVCNYAAVRSVQMETFNRQVGRLS